MSENSEGFSLPPDVSAERRLLLHDIQSRLTSHGLVAAETVMEPETAITVLGGTIEPFESQGKIYYQDMKVVVVGIYP